MVLSISKQGFWTAKTRDCMASYRADNNDKYIKVQSHIGPYRVVPGDVLELQMPVVLRVVSSEFSAWLKPAYGRKDYEPYLVRVSDDGTITLPIVGKLPAADKTLSEIEALVIDAYYPKYVVNLPMVVCEVVKYRRENQRVFTVIGLVNRANAFPYPPDVQYNLMEALGGHQEPTQVWDPPARFAHLHDDVREYDVHGLSDYETISPNQGCLWADQDRHRRQTDRGLLLDRSLVTLFQYITFDTPQSTDFLAHRDLGVAILFQQRLGQIPQEMVVAVTMGHPSEFLPEALDKRFLFVRNPQTNRKTQSLSPLSGLDHEPTYLGGRTRYQGLGKPYTFTT